MIVCRTGKCWLIKELLPLYLYLSDSAFQYLMFVPFIKIKNLYRFPRWRECRESNCSFFVGKSADFENSTPSFTGL